MPEVAGCGRVLLRLGARGDERWQHATEICATATARRDTLLAPLYPLDRVKNANGRRRVLGPVASVAADAAPPAAAKGTEMAPLLRQLIDAYDRTGLPPTYLPKHDKPASDDPENP